MARPTEDGVVLRDVSGGLTWSGSAPLLSVQEMGSSKGCFLSLPQPCSSPPLTQSLNIHPYSAQGHFILSLENLLDPISHKYKSTYNVMFDPLCLFMI